MENNPKSVFEVNPTGPTPSNQRVNIDESQERAEKGDSESQALLGHVYFYGMGVEIDKAEAVRWYIEAATSNYLEAQFALGLIYRNGDGVERNLSKSNSWFLKAGLQRLGAAFRELAKNSILEKRDPNGHLDALFWSTLGKYYGDAEAAKMVNELTSHISQTQVSEINKRVRSWLEENDRGPA